jgi:predicted MFS family arabinose efflux permease
LFLLADIYWVKTIAADLHGTAIEAFWAGTSFQLTSTVFQPTWADLSHIVDQKSVLMVAVFIFTIGSTVAAVAANFTALLPARKEHPRCGRRWYYCVDLCHCLRYG